jgi:hypothetical protein
MGTPIGVLRRFANEIRLAFHVGSTRVTSSHPAGRKVAGIARGLVRATDGVGENYMVCAYSAERIWIDVKTDEEREVCINPRADFSDPSVPTGTVFVVLDLTDLLHGLLA